MTLYFHVKPPGIPSGTVLPRGSYGRYLLAQGMSATSDPIQEHLRETIRAAHYPDKPSRLLSSFVFEIHDDAVFFRDNWRIGHSVYQVRFTTNPKSLHRVCYTAWDTTLANQVFQAHSFWRSPALYSSNTEVFAEEDLVVL